MSDRLATTDMGQKVGGGCSAHLYGGVGSHLATIHKRYRQTDRQNNVPVA